MAERARRRVSPSGCADYANKANKQADRQTDRYEMHTCASHLYVSATVFVASFFDTMAEGSALFDVLFYVLSIMLFRAMQEGAR